MGSSDSTPTKTATKYATSSSTESTSSIFQQEHFASADMAIHKCATKFTDFANGMKILYHLRSAVLRIVRSKKQNEKELSTADAERTMNDINMNIYIDDKCFVCQIGKGGTLLVLNIIGDHLDFEWNDLSGKCEGLSSEDIKDLGIAIGHVGG